MLTNVDLTKIYTTQEFNLGEVYRVGDGQKEYRFVYYDAGDGSVTAAAGRLAYLCVSGTTTVPAWSVTMDHDSATTVATTYSNGIGIFMAALTDGTYGWIQTKGFSDNALLTDGSVAAGGALVAADADGTITSQAVTAVAARTFGQALADDSSTSLAAANAVLNFI